MKTKKSMTQLGAEVAEDHMERQIRAIESAPLTHDETLRGTALSLACRYYVETIVKDGDLYREMVRDNRVLKPATFMGVLQVALAFEAFIRGELKRDADAVSDVDVEELTQADREEAPAAETR